MYQLYSRNRHSIQAIRQALMENTILYDDKTTPEDIPPLGRYGKLREQYLFRSRRNYYNRLQATGRIRQHLEETDTVACCMATELTDLLRQANRIPVLPSGDEAQWEGHLQDIRRQVEEVILTELIYL